MDLAVRQRTGPMAVAALVAAILSLFLSPVAGFFLALLAIVMGIVGFLKSFSPRTSGGLMSLSAIVLGVVGLVVQVIHGVFRVLF
jgi:hypothetical protein